MSTKATTATLGAISIGIPVPLNYHNNLPVTIQVVVTLVNTSSVEFTTDNILDTLPDGTLKFGANGVNAAWTALPAPFSGLTLSVGGSFTFPVMAVRLNMTAWTSGGATMKVLQGDGQS